MKKIIILTLCFLAISNWAFCQEPLSYNSPSLPTDSGGKLDGIVIDLAKDAKSYELPINPQKNLKITVINQILNGKFQYNVSINIENQEMPQLPIGDIPIPTFLDANKGFKADCEKIKKVNEEFISLTDEKKLRELREKFILLTEMELPKIKDCPEIVTFQRNFVSLGINTEHIIPEIKKGQNLIITITRVGGTDSGKEWKWTFKTPNRGRWQTNYGFNHLTNWISAREEYYLKSFDSGAFEITKENNVEKFNVRPSVLFTWIPSQSATREFTLSLSGGFGVDFDDPSILFGAGFNYNQNINLSLGVASHKQQKLKGKYSAGDKLIENLESDQLHESSFAINPFINISFNFSSNPFKKKEDSSNSTNNKENQGTEESGDNEGGN